MLLWSVGSGNCLVHVATDADRPSFALCLSPSLRDKPQLLTGGPRGLCFWADHSHTSEDGSSDGGGGASAVSEWERQYRLSPLLADTSVARGATCAVVTESSHATAGHAYLSSVDIVSAHSSGDVCCWRLTYEAALGKGAPAVRLSKRQAAAHHGPALALAACGEGGSLVASGGVDGRVRLWSSEGLWPVRTISLAHCWSALPLLGHAAASGFAYAADTAAQRVVRGLCAAGSSELVVSNGDLLALSLDSAHCSLMRSGGHVAAGTLEGERGSAEEDGAVRRRCRGATSERRRRGGGRRVGASRSRFR